MEEPTRTADMTAQIPNGAFDAEPGEVERGVIVPVAALVAVGWTPPPGVPRTKGTGPEGVILQVHDYLLDDRSGRLSKVTNICRVPKGLMVKVAFDETGIKEGRLLRLVVGDADA